MSTKGGNENPIFVAFGVEENSLMRRSDLTDLTAFVADNFSFERSPLGSVSRVSAIRRAGHAVPPLQALLKSSGGSRKSLPHISSRTRPTVMLGET
jgi:hypothetical protein